MNTVDLFFSDDDEDEEVLEVDSIAVVRRFIRDHSNPLDLPNSTFIESYRLSKEAFTYLLNEVGPIMNRRLRASAVPAIIKLAAFLRFLADGGFYQTDIAKDYNLGISQPTFSNILKEMLNIFDQNVCPKWITFHMTDQEKEETKLGFCEEAGFPGVIGIIQGIQIRILRPVKGTPHRYLNRKGYHSVNALLVCDNKMRIRYVDANHTGSCRNSYMWSKSSMKKMLQQSYDQGERNHWLLGDLSFPLEPYLITPFPTISEQSTQNAVFNKAHSKTHNIVRKAIGHLKNRFKCLLPAKELHYNPEKVTQIINTCCSLHNMCLQYKIEQYVDNIEEQGVFDQYTTDDQNELAISFRNEIIKSINSWKH